MIPLQITLARLKVRREAYCQCLHNGALAMPDLENHWFTERLAYNPCQRTLCGGERQVIPFLTLNQAPKLKANIRWWVKHHLSTNAVRSFATFLGSSDLSQPLKKRHRKLVVSSASDPHIDWLSWSMEEVHSNCNWTPGLGVFNNSEFLPTWWLVQNVLPLFSLNY